MLASLLIAVSPLIPGDYSDPDVIRTGTNYYLVTSSFAMSPGVPVLRSNDLRNWTTVAHAVPDLTKFSPKYGPDQLRMYGKGIYAPSIRAHRGKYYVYVPSVDEGIIVSVAERPEGPWTADWLRKPDGTPWREGRWTDPCPFWDADGTGHLAASSLSRNWTGWLFKLSDDGLRLLDAGWCFSPYRSTEGHKLYRRGDYYYLFHIEFLPAGHGEGSYFLRSKDLNGPYELRYIPLSIPGQGALVDTPEGKWWWIAQFNTPKEPIGRAPYLCPVTWQDDWPEIAPPIEPGAGSCEQAWQCNHVAEAGAWDFAVRPGWLRIRQRPECAALAEKDFFRTPNVACKRVLQYDGEAHIVVDIDVSRLPPGARAGLALFNGGADFALTYGCRAGDVLHCEWTVRGRQCVANGGETATLGGAKYRGLNFGLWTTGEADFRVVSEAAASVRAHPPKKGLAGGANQL
ncbi:MAG: family 43 glycosylhydrolase [Kiritimatiellia bacterium]